ncbi:MAG TPA: phage tail tube protein [Gemmatimonadaceae bacterium]|nr:phage tail tube protein [Gemmatimonadaceae bacterium]
MPTYQSGKNVTVAYKPETTFGIAAAGGAGAKRFRLNGGGLALARATIAPNEIRSDLKTSMGRYGSRSVSGSFAGDLSVGTFDDLIEAALRGTWIATQVITAATFTTLTPGANTFTAAAGSFLSSGFRVGQVIRRTGGGIAGNNARNLRVTGVTATVLTVAETLTAGAGDGTGSIDIMKRLSQPSSVVRRSFTFDEYSGDIDQSELYVGNRVGSLKISGGPDSMATIEIGLVGVDGSVLTQAASPYFTNPVASGSIGLTMADASLRFGGVDQVTVTAFDLSIDNKLGTQAVIGSNASPDVFDNAVEVSGSISVIRSDLTNVTRFLSETELELQVLLGEPEAEPRDFISLFLPRIKVGMPGRSLGADNAMIESLPFMVGNKDIATGYEDTMVQVSTSAV